MENKKNFKLLSLQLVSIVDFIKWTSSFSDGALEQMEAPMSGVRLKPALNSLFAFAKDDLGWMLTMHEKEGAWLAHLPVSAVFTGYNDGVIVTIAQVAIFGEIFEPTALDIFVPNAALLEQLQGESLFGFGLLRESGEVERVNRMVPLYTRAQYEAQAIGRKKETSQGLFSL